ncbi:4-(cytidine 5'-diphospho)-2-C-methyl-D-erythritol kinase [Nesterenkonia populi]
MRDSQLFGHVTAVAPGKVNLSLRAGPLRPDGYHDVATLYCAVSLYEEVTASPREDDAITVTVSERSVFTGVDLLDESTGERVTGEIPLGASNLAYRAAALLRDRLKGRRAGVLSGPWEGSAPAGWGVDLTLVKNVPVAGGMGGGSADAAAALVACSALWDAGLSKEQLAEIGSELGADVPFALMGGAAAGQGVGDELSPLLHRGELHLVITPASVGLSTPGVYRTLDAMRERAGVQADTPELDPDLVRAVSRSDAESLSALMVNDLQAPAVSRLPELDELMDLGLSEGAMQGIVSGSGPTVFFLAHDAAHASQLATSLEERAEVWAIPVTAPAPGARLLAQK